jgi:hypothetical protein
MFQGTLRPDTVSINSERVVSRLHAQLTQHPPRYRGSTCTNRRRGTARTPYTAPGHVCGHQCGSLTPAFIRALGGRDAACRRYCSISLDLGDGAHGGIALWRGAQQWVEVVVRCAYSADYLRIRPLLVTNSASSTGGGVSLRSVLAVAGAMADAADYDSGRNSRLSVQSIVRATGLGERTVQRARQALKLLRVATEVLRGRQRTKHERFASWRVGDRSRGWASVWALHPVKPVDRTRVVDAGIVRMAPHPRRGLFSSPNSRRELLNTNEPVEKRAAPRPSTTRKGLIKRERDRQGALLAAKWLGNARTPHWARRHTSRGWAAALREAAEHGWTPADLNDVVDEWARANRVTPMPHTPLAFVRWLLSQQDLAFPPHLLVDIARAQDEEDRQQQTRLREAERSRRNAASASPDSTARKAAREVAVRAAEQARQRRSLDRSKDLAHRAVIVTRARRS